MNIAGGRGFIIDLKSSNYYNTKFREYYISTDKKYILSYDHVGHGGGGIQLEIFNNQYISKKINCESHTYMRKDGKEVSEDYGAHSLYVEKRGNKDYLVYYFTPRELSEGELKKAIDLTEVIKNLIK
jgi:hypothetical protein